MNANLKNNRKTAIKTSKIQQMNFHKQSIVEHSNKIEIRVAVFLRKEGSCFVAYCPALDLSSYGKTGSEAKKAFEGALKIFLEETKIKGTLEKVLLNLGWSLRKLPNICYEPPRIREENLLESVRTIRNVHFQNVAIPV
jgi:predicted RNase H-like HicB family nuclease